MTEHPDLFVTSTGSTHAAQTTENTTAPHEAKPKKSGGFTKEMRDAKIAAGWIPPEKRGKVEVNPITHDRNYVDTQADVILTALVNKLVALENNDQYRSVWLHFFNHGGTFSGPNYVNELQTACDYLNAKKQVE